MLFSKPEINLQMKFDAYIMLIKILHDTYRRKKKFIFNQQQFFTDTILISLLECFPLMFKPRISLTADLL